MLSAVKRRQKKKINIVEEVSLPQTPLPALHETWAKIYSGIESLEGATLESFRPICGEEQDLFS